MVVHKPKVINCKFYEAASLLLHGLHTGFASAELQLGAYLPTYQFISFRFLIAFWVGGEGVRWLDEMRVGLEFYARQEMLLRSLDPLYVGMTMLKKP